jgi:hypothetical protein
VSAEARERDVPILLSVGFTTYPCCLAMAHEPAVATRNVETGDCRISDVLPGAAEDVWKDGRSRFHP